MILSTASLSSHDLHQQRTFPESSCSGRHAAGIAEYSSRLRSLRSHRSNNQRWAEVRNKGYVRPILAVPESSSGTISTPTASLLLAAEPITSTSPLVDGAPAGNSNRRKQMRRMQEVPAEAGTYKWTAQKQGLQVDAIACGVMLTLAAQALWHWLHKRAAFKSQLDTVLSLASSVIGDAFGSGQSAVASQDQRGQGSDDDVRSEASSLPAGLGKLDEEGETVEWVNMWWRKAWRVYQRGLERWIIDVLQPTFDYLCSENQMPSFIKRLRIVEMTLDHEAPYFSNTRQRKSRKDSDLVLVTDLRYTGGARMLLELELGEGRWRFKVPVLITDLDVDCKLWLKLRLAPVCPWVGTISLAFLGPPNIKVQLSPYNRVRLMRIPVVQTFLRQLLTVDLPAAIILPKRVEIDIPPSVQSLAEAAVGRDTIMRAVASAVLQADALEQALLSALPVGPQTAAGGIILPELFKGELNVHLRSGRNLPVWGFPGQSNPFCRLCLGEQAVESRKEVDTGEPGRHRFPVWNQEFEFLVEDPTSQKLEIFVKDSNMTGRIDVGRITVPLSYLLPQGTYTAWLPLQPPEFRETSEGGEILVDITYKPFEEDDEGESGFHEAELYARTMATKEYVEQSGSNEPITDIRSAAAASSRAAVAASAAITAVAMTQAAAARAAARATKAAQSATKAAQSAAASAAAALPLFQGTPSPTRSEVSTTETASVEQPSSSSSDSDLEDYIILSATPGSSNGNGSNGNGSRVLSSTTGLVDAESLQREQLPLTDEGSRSFGASREVEHCPRAELFSGITGSMSEDEHPYEGETSSLLATRGSIGGSSSGSLSSISSSGYSTGDEQQPPIQVIVPASSIEENTDNNGRNELQSRILGLVSSVVSRVAPNYGKKEGNSSEASSSDSDSGGSSIVETDSKENTKDRKQDSKSEAGESRAWWEFWKGEDRGEASGKDEVKAQGGGNGVATGSSGGEEKNFAKEGGGHWWWPFGGGAEEKDEGKAAGSGTDSDVDAADKPVENVYIPPDLPIEEIAKELALLKEENWRSKDDNSSKMWNLAVEKKDRGWIIVLCFLLVVTIALLTDVAFILNPPWNWGVDP